MGGLCAVSEENGDVLSHSYVVQEPSIPDEPILVLAENQEAPRSAESSIHCFKRIKRPRKCYRTIHTTVSSTTATHAAYSVYKYPSGCLLVDFLALLRTSCRTIQM